MAENSSDKPDCLIRTGKQYLSYLQHIRHWENSLVAEDAGLIWVSGLTPEQTAGTEVKSIPFADLFRERNGLLFREGALLPDTKLPQQLNWKPISQAIPVSLPSMNHNFFGIGKKVRYTLQPSGKEQPPIGLLTLYSSLQNYIESAPAVRLRPLIWNILNDVEPEVLILGSPLLPLPGLTFWQQGQLLMPTGMEPTFPILNELVLKEMQVSPSQLLFWKNAEETMVLNPQDFKQLSISSFRLTKGI